MGSNINKTDAEIDQIVDELVTDEKMANALKEKLHHAGSDAADIYAPGAAADDDADEMWDNMPV